MVFERPAMNKGNRNFHSTHSWSYLSAIQNWKSLLPLIWHTFQWTDFQNIKGTKMKRAKIYWHQFDWQYLEYRDSGINWYFTKWRIIFKQMRHIQRKVSLDICKSQTVLLNAVHDRASNSFPQIRWNQMICKRKSLIGELYTKIPLSSMLTLTFLENEK